MDLEALVADHDTVVVAAPDVQGRLVGRRIGVDRFVAAPHRGVDVASCVYAWDIAQNPELVIEGRLAFTSVASGMGDVVFRPDLASLRPATWLERSAVVLADATGSDGEPVVVDPRHLLRTQVDALAADGYRASVGTELEFHLFHGTPSDLRGRGFADLSPTTLTAADFSILEGDAYEPFFADVRRRLGAAGIEVEAAQVEFGLGQWETTLVHTDPLEMADRHVLYKLALKTLAARAGYTATFMAKPLDDGMGSSCHVHLSLTDLEGTPVFWDEDAVHRVGRRLRAAIGGVLAHAGDLTAWYCPTVNAYPRIREAGSAAGWGTTWGIDHRFTTVRVVGHRPDELRLEFRLPGADTNPYLTLAALLASVRRGLADDLDPGPATDGDPFLEPPEGIPLELGAAADRFAGSEFARSTFGAEVVEHYATLARWEWQQYVDSVSDWHRLRYFDLI